MKPSPSEALARHAKSRTASVLGKVCEALRMIELDIESNDGLYPFNGGRVSKAEICRRAGVHKVTLQNPAHRDSTRKMIDDWMHQVSSRLVTGKKVVRKTVTTRADDWKEKYLAAAAQTNLYHLQMVTLRDRAERANARVEELETEVVRLQSLLSEGRVVGIRKKAR